MNITKKLAVVVAMLAGGVVVGCAGQTDDEPADSDSQDMRAIAVQANAAANRSTQTQRLSMCGIWCYNNYCCPMNGDAITTGSCYASVTTSDGCHFTF